MATVSTPSMLGNPNYPSSDGKPMAETDQHRELMNALIQLLKTHYASDPQTYVSGNLLLFYTPGNKRRHVAPDVFVVHGVPRGDRLNYITWEEGKGPDVVIELTSSSTRHEDTARKFRLYEKTLKVAEYFVFDPLGDYLQPALQGHRLRNGKYVPIRPVQHRLPSQSLGLHLEEHGAELRLFNPATNEYLASLQEENQRLRQEVAELRRRLHRP